MWLASLLAALCACGDDDSVPIESTPSAAGGHDGGGGAAGGEGGSGGAGGTAEIPLEPGEVAWSVEIVPENISGSRFVASRFDVAPDGSAFMLSCTACPQGIGDLTINDARGTTTLVESDCGFTSTGLNRTQCRVIGFDADGAFRSLYPFRVDGYMGGVTGTLEADADGLTMDLVVFGNPGFELTTDTQTQDVAGSGRIHLELSPDGEELALDIETTTLVQRQSHEVTCASYRGDPSFEAIFGVDSTPLGFSEVAMVGDRCMVVGEVRGDGAAVAGLPVAAPPTRFGGFVALLDASGTGSVATIDGDDRISTGRVVAGHENRGAFSASTIVSSTMTVAGVEVTFPAAQSRMVVAQVDQDATVTATTTLVATGAPSGTLSGVSSALLTYSPEGRLVYMAKSFGKMRYYEGDTLVSDFGDSIDNAYFWAEIGPDGDLLFTAVPFTEGEMLSNVMRADGNYMMHSGFVAEDTSVAIGGRTFSTANSSVLSLVGL